MKKILLILIGLIISINAYAFGTAGCDQNAGYLTHLDTASGTQFFESDCKGDGLMTMTTGLNATSTTDSKFGPGAYFDNGAEGYVSVPDSEEFNFGSGRFTIDFWIKAAAFQQEAGIVANSNSAPITQDVDNAFDLRVDGSNVNNLQVLIYSSGSNILSMSAAHGMSTGIWYHIALIRGWGGNVDDWALTVNGAPIATTTAAITYPNFTNAFSIGWSARAGNRFFNGSIDELRVSKGVARWTSNFTPPSSPYCSGCEMMGAAV